MKKIVYSGVTKFVAVILFIASVVLGTLCVTDGITTYFDEETKVYYFENDFSESSYVSHLLDEPENVVFHAYHNLYYTYNNYGEPVDRDTPIEVNAETIGQNLQQRFDDFYYSDKINYFVQWNDMIFTNCNATSPEELMQGEYYSYIKRDSSGHVERASTHKYRMYLLEDIYQYDDTSTIIISANIKQEVIDEYKALWEKQQSIVIDTITQSLICIAVALVSLIYLLCVCGKNKDGELKNMWLDTIWTDIHLAAAGGSGICTVMVGALLLDEYISGHFAHNLLHWIMGSVAFLSSTIIITSLLSIIRNIKCRRFIESSIIFRVIRWCLRILIKIAKWFFRSFKTFWKAVFRILSKKSGIIMIGSLFIYTAIIGIFGLFSAIFASVWIFLGILLFGFACFILAYRSKDFDEIKKGVSEVRNGNVAYKIPELKCEDMRALAVNINDIAKGLDESVSAKVKAERMKTELITNVSHDLKTPITSIISYTELLSQIENLPEEARDYVSVISKKSERLKNLTLDLFDISKVQSGNEDVILEKIDVSLLINQSLGEHDNEIQISELPFIVEAPKELYIAADGRKMSRVVSNLINNILKYTMKNTRVFITAFEKEGNVVIEFKNIASYPMNFNSDEITQRFTRGDESRTQEGNGLGLAIAKSYTEICNGKFEIVTDGDMFKAILTFRKYS